LTEESLEEPVKDVEGEEDQSTDVEIVCRDGAEGASWGDLMGNAVSCEVAQDVVKALFTSNFFEFEEVLDPADAVLVLIVEQLDGHGQDFFWSVFLLDDLGDAHLGHAVGDSHLFEHLREAEHGYAEVVGLYDAICATVSEEKLGLWVSKHLRLGHPVAEEHIWKVEFLDLGKGGGKLLQRKNIADLGWVRKSDHFNNLVHLIFRRHERRSKGHIYDVLHPLEEGLVLIR
jgi:hypothetical protein